MFIVLLPSMSERSGSSEKEVKMFDTLEKLQTFLLTTPSNLSRVEIWEAQQRFIQFGLES